jgi:MFS family permease
MERNTLKYSLLSASLLVGSAAAINANIPAMAEHFNTIPLSTVEMITTIPSLFLMISILTSSMIAKKIGFKRTIVIGIGIVMIAGLIPLVIDNFTVILISRGALGFGVGLFNSLLVSMINHFYTGESLSNMYGLQSAFESAGGIFIMFIAGQLLRINWQIPFLAYLIAIPVFLIYLRNVPTVSTEEIMNNRTTKQSDNDTNDGSFLPVIGYVLLIFMAAILYMIMGIKVASLVTSQGYGSASDASLVLILLSLGGIVAGVFFGRLIKFLKGYITSIGLLILALAMVLLAFSNHIIITLIGGFFAGFGFKLFMPSIINKVNTSKIRNKSLATSLLLVGFNLGAFVSPYGSVLIQNMINSDSLISLFRTNAIIFILLAILALVPRVVKKDNKL